MQEGGRPGGPEEEEEEEVVVVVVVVVVLEEVEALGAPPPLPAPPSPAPLPNLPAGGGGPRRAVGCHGGGLSRKGLERGVGEGGAGVPSRASSSSSPSSSSSSGLRVRPGRAAGRVGLTGRRGPDARGAGAGLHTASSQRWAPMTDGKLTVQWENNSTSCICTVYWLAA